MSEAVAMEQTEAYEELLSMAQGKTGAIAPELLARHVLTVALGGDWPVQRAAMEAVLRRCAFGKKERLRVSSRPPAGKPLGTYRTRRRGAPDRPYLTLIAGVDPIGASCDCPDFLRNSLGLCKHVLVALNDIAKRPRVQRRAIELQTAGLETKRPFLGWDPVRPLHGAGDWLDRVRLESTSGSAAIVKATAGKIFAPTRNGLQPLRSTHYNDVHKRLALVEKLLNMITSSKGRRRAAVATVPAVVALLQTERERLHHLCVYEISRAEIRTATRSMKLKLYPYQREGVARFLSTGSLLLADDMGLGKTAQAVGACHVLWNTERIRRGLLIVPASLKPQWLREWQSFSDTPLHMVEGSPAERRKTYRQTKRGYLLTNYEALLRDFAEIHAWKPDVIVLDEAQRIKNWATKTAVYVKRLEPRYRLVLTGTPMENRLDELASIFDWVNGFALEPKWRLTPWHVSYADGTKEIEGARNLNTLRERLAPSMIRRTRQEVLDQLPPRTDTVIPVAITEAQKEEHDVLNQPIVSILARGRRRPLTPAEFLRLMSLLTTQRIIANGMAQLRFVELWPSLANSSPDPALLESLATPKLLELRELLEQVVLQQQRKVVVFSQWRRMLELAGWVARDVLGPAGRRAVFFTGQESQKRRTQNIIELHDDPMTCVLLASDAGGVGLNLQKAANCCINMDLPWNPAVLEQRIGRIYRIGQNHPINVYNLVTQNSIEERIAGLVADKQALFTGLFDGSSNEVLFNRSGSFLSQLERIIEPAEVPEVDDEETEFEEEEAAFGREIDEIVGAADEADDPAPAPAEPRAALAPPSTIATAPPPGADSVPADVGALFAQLRVTSTPQGGISIEAPPGAASTLASVFEGMAKLLRAQE